MINITTLETLNTSLSGELFFDDLHKNIYATDASVYRKIPLAVAFPKDIKDIQTLIAFATKSSVKKMSSYLNFCNYSSKLILTVL